MLRLSANDMVRVFGWYSIAIGGVGIRGGWLVAVCFFRFSFLFVFSSGKLVVFSVFLIGGTNTDSTTSEDSRTKV